MRLKSAKARDGAHYNNELPHIEITMQYKTFRITISSPERSEGELNAFLRGHRILSVERSGTPVKVNPT
jgi:hypothetical protein